MTTPAVNINTGKGPLTAIQYQENCGGSFVTIGTSADFEYQVTDVRPASVNSPKNSYGWRNPTNWSRAKTQYTRRPSGEVSGCEPAGACAPPNGGKRLKHLWDHSPVNSIGIVSLGTAPAYLSQQATTKAYLNLKNSQANFSVMFAERHETARLFSSNVKKIAGSVRAFRGRSPKEWGQVIKRGVKAEGFKVPQSWLELQYGWKPLMSDVSGACQALSKRERDAGAYHAHVKGSASGLSTASSVWDFNYIQAGKLGQDITILNDYHVVTRLWYDLNNPLLATFSSLGLTNPLELAWERVKYSFVVDWFLPIGNWLSTLDADFGWVFKAGCRSTFVRTKAVGRPFARPFTNGWSSPLNYSGDYRFDGTRFTRALLSQPPGVGLPHFKNPFSSTHIANAMSLLTQAFRR